MAKDLVKSSWEENYQNKSLSGIEIRDKDGKLVSFIAIRYDEILDKNTIHRITIKIDENAKPILPPAQTFEEIIQAKRRQQMLLYGSGSSTTTTLSDRTARRVAAAARQSSASRPLPPSRRVAVTLPKPSRSSKSKKKKSSGSKKAKPAVSALKTEPLKLNAESQASKQAAPRSKSNTSPAANPAANAPVTLPPSTSASSVVTSMKDFKKHMPSLPIDPKEVKLLLKSAPPGACVVLADGTIVKKSRRGGARVGAGRKRSRPLPANHQSSVSRNSSTSRDNNAQKAGKEKVLETSNDLSCSDASLEGDHGSHDN